MGKQQAVAVKCCSIRFLLAFELLQYCKAHLGFPDGDEQSCIFGFCPVQFCLHSSSLMSFFFFSGFWDLSLNFCVQAYFVGLLPSMQASLFHKPRCLIVQGQVQFSHKLAAAWIYGLGWIFLVPFCLLSASQHHDWVIPLLWEKIGCRFDIVGGIKFWADYYMLIFTSCREQM